MNILRLIFANLKRYIKSKPLLAGLVFMPFTLIVILFMFNGSENISMYEPNILLVCDSNGKYESELIKELKLDDKNIFNCDKKNHAINKLKNNDTSTVFVLDKNFSYKLDNTIQPYIKTYKTQTGGGSIWSESVIESFVNDKIAKSIDSNISSKLITSKIIKNNTLESSNAMMSMLLICYFLYANSGVLCKDLLDLRSNNVLTRILSTKNKNIEIVFSIFFALFLLQLLSCFIVLIALNFIFDVSISITTCLVLIANCFTSTGFIIALTRIFKNEASISIVSIIYSISMMFLGILSLLGSLSGNLAFLNNLSKLSPLYWTLEAISHSNVGISILAIFLIGLVFVTAGSFKLREFAKN
ncbi:MAG: ABC transporter permease [Romboutsia sp.]